MHSIKRFSATFAMTLIVITLPLSSISMIGGRYEKIDSLRYHYTDLFSTDSGDERTRAGATDTIVQVIP
jgi:hypothetical protein